LKKTNIRCKARWVVKEPLPQDGIINQIPTSGVGGAVKRVIIFITIDVQAVGLGHSLRGVNTPAGNGA